MLDASTLVPLGVVIPTCVWIGRKIVQATSAAVELKNEIKALRNDLHEKVSRRDFQQWMERLGYKNPTLTIPDAPAYEDKAA